MGSQRKSGCGVAIGAAYTGKRAMAAMKHVGLNVAADSFMYSSMTGMEAHHYHPYTYDVDPTI
jgi:TPP-dependent indolepyruvate ferredoxin oxidoreductase alpha subunit